MGAQIELTTRDKEVLAALTHKIRCLSVRQVAAHWWGDAEAALRTARRRLNQLEGEGLVQCFDLFCRPEIELSGPLIVWRPGEPKPDLGALAWTLKSRWDGMAAIRTRLVAATKESARTFGGRGGRRPRPVEATHDLHLAKVYLRFLKVDPKRAKRWVSEAELVARARGRQVKLPDALILGRRRDHHVIEFGGEYSKQKLLAMHDDFAGRGFSYEIW